MTQPNYDYNFAGVKPDIREVIPAQTKLLLKFNYTPGGYGPDGKPTNGGPLTKSKATAENPNPDVLYLKSEFTVMRGPYKGRKFWSNLTVVGGQVNEQGASKGGKITRETIRLILDSANGLSSKDDSPEAAAKRVLPQGFQSLQNITFVGTAKVEPAQGNYPEKNVLGSVLTIDNKQYPTEQELDNPPKPAAAKNTVASLPAPAWVAPSGSATPPSQSGAATVGAGPIAPSPTVPFAPAQVGSVVPLTTGNPVQSGLPAWAQPGGN
jgi:hypothetical protein